MIGDHPLQRLIESPHHDAEAAPAENLQHLVVAQSAERSRLRGGLQEIERNLVRVVCRSAARRIPILLWSRGTIRFLMGRAPQHHGPDRSLRGALDRGAQRPFHDAGRLLVSPEHRLDALAEFSIRTALAVENGGLSDSIVGSLRQFQDFLNSFGIDRHGIVVRLGKNTRSQVILKIRSGEGFHHPSRPRSPFHHTDCGACQRPNGIREHPGRATSFPGRRETKGARGATRLSCDSLRIWTTLNLRMHRAAASDRLRCCPIRRTPTNCRAVSNGESRGMKLTLGTD